MKTILITGTSSGFGFDAAKYLAEKGHHVIASMRNVATSNAEAANELTNYGKENGLQLDVVEIDVTSDESVNKAAANLPSVDVLINNAGVLKTPNPITEDGLDIRFAVNTIAPYLFTRQLLPLLGTSGRVINLSSAAQAPVDPAALAGQKAALKLARRYGNAAAGGPRSEIITMQASFHGRTFATLAATGRRTSALSAPVLGSASSAHRSSNKATAQQAIPSISPR